jgi:hypothetical protein
MDFYVVGLSINNFSPAQLRLRRMELELRKKNQSQT